MGWLEYKLSDFSADGLVGIHNLRFFYRWVVGIQNFRFFLQMGFRVLFTLCSSLCLFPYQILFHCSQLCIDSSLESLETNWYCQGFLSSGRGDEQRDDIVRIEQKGAIVLRSRHGYFHVVNNDYTHCENIGGSVDPTINSQGNRYLAPFNPFAKEVTKRVDTDAGQWKVWNWSEGDILLNGTYFTPSSTLASTIYSRASSLGAKSSSMVASITSSAGVLPAVAVNSVDSNPNQKKKGIFKTIQ